MTDKPNFVLFVTDQHRADYLGCYGHPVLQTPNIDALAAQGVCHDRFYVTSPVCMPNRASLMTCRMPSSHGSWTNGTPLSKRNVTFVELLRDAGYDTALIGKSHLQNYADNEPAARQPMAREGFHAAQGELAYAYRSGFSDASYRQERRSKWDSADAKLSLPFYGFDHVDLVTGHGDVAGGQYLHWLRANTPDAGDLTGADNQLPHDYICPQAVRTRVPEDLYTTSFVARKAVEWLEARRGSDRPFFLMVSWPDPHHPFNPPGRYWDMYRPEQMAVPDAFTRNDWQPPSYVSGAIRMRENGNAMLNGYGSFACTEREALEARALTCGMIAMIDDAVGTISETLSATGRSGQTVKIFTSDHGDHLGDHKLLLKGAEQYEQITRVPFIWSDPDGDKGARESGIGQTHDIGATILERAKVQPSWGMQGQPLPVVGGAARGAALIQYDQQRGGGALGEMPRVHTVRDSRYRLSIYEGVETGELYDLEEDPGEFTNLWDVPSATGAKLGMLEKLARLEIAAASRVPEPNGMA